MWSKVRSSNYASSIRFNFRRPKSVDERILRIFPLSSLLCCDNSGRSLTQLPPMFRWIPLVRGTNNTCVCHSSSNETDSSCLPLEPPTNSASRVRENSGQQVPDAGRMRGEQSGAPGRWNRSVRKRRSKQRYRGPSIGPRVRAVKARWPGEKSSLGVFQILTSQATEPN